MTSVLPFDEINRFNTQIRERFGTEKLKFTDDLDDILDMMFDLFLLAYAMGNEATMENLGYLLPEDTSKLKPTEEEIIKTLDEKVAGKTWRERVKEFFGKAEKGEINLAPGQSGAENQDAESGVTNLTDAIIRIAETETHRIANTSALNTAKKIGATSKTWVTMMDDKVRDTHSPLESMTIPIDEDFYTWDDDFAPAPGLFQLPQNNINCRCELIFS